MLIFLAVGANDINIVSQHSYLVALDYRISVNIIFLREGLNRLDLLNFSENVSKAPLLRLISWLKLTFRDKIKGAHPSLFAQFDANTTCLSAGN